MSVNFTPGADFGPHSKINSEMYKSYNTAGIKQNKVNKTKNQPKLGNEQRNIKTDNYITHLEFLYAAALLAQAQVMMSKMQPIIPDKVTDSSKRAHEHLEIATATAKEAVNKADSIKKLFEEGDKTGPDGEILREISEPDENGVQIMKEYDGNGLVTRESRFKDGIPVKTEEFTPDGRKNIIEFRKGEISEYTEGLKNTEDGIKKEKYITFDKGKPAVYYENCKEFNSGASYVGSGILFYDGQMGAYYEDMQDFDDGSSLIGLHLRYDKEDKMYEYVENIYTSFDEGMKIGKKLLLEDGKWVDRTPQTGAA